MQKLKAFAFLLGKATKYQLSRHIVLMYLLPFHFLYTATSKVTALHQLSTVMQGKHLNYFVQWLYAESMAALTDWLCTAFWTYLYTCSQLLIVNFSVLVALSYVHFFAVLFQYHQFAKSGVYIIWVPDSFYSDACIFCKYCTQKLQAS